MDVKFYDYTSNGVGARILLRMGRQVETIEIVGITMMVQHAEIIIIMINYIWPLVVLLREEKGINTKVMPACYNG
jgi:hypothetical protein